MLYKSEFKVDQFHLRHTRDPKGLLEHIKYGAARNIGIELCKQIPFTLNEEKSDRRKGQDLNNYPPINPQNALQDHYETEFFAVSRKDWEEFKKEFKDKIFKGLLVLGTGEIKAIFDKIENK